MRTHIERVNESRRSDRERYAAAHYAEEHMEPAVGNGMAPNPNAPAHRQGSARNMDCCVYHAIKGQVLCSRSILQKFLTASSQMNKVESEDQVKRRAYYYKKLKARYSVLVGKNLTVQRHHRRLSFYFSKRANQYTNKPFTENTLANVRRLSRRLSNLNKMLANFLRFAKYYEVRMRNAIPARRGLGDVSFPQQLPLIHGTPAWMNTMIKTETD